MTLGRGLYGLPEPPKPPKPPATRLRKVMIVLLVLAGIVTVSLTTLYMLGGNSPRMKYTIERYLSDSTGMRVTVGKLNAVSFYPVIGVDMNDVQFYDATHENAVSVGHFNISIGFWGMSSDSSIHSLDIGGVSLAAGLLTPRRLEVERFYIDVAKPSEPVLSLKGQYGGEPLHATVSLKPKYGLSGRVYFHIADPSPFMLRAGAIKADGHLQLTDEGRMIVADRFQAGDGLPVKGTVTLAFASGQGGMKGGLELGKSALAYDLNITRHDSGRMVKGQVQARTLEMQDLSGKGGLAGDYRIFHDFYGAGPNPVKTAVDVNFTHPAGRSVVTRNDRALVFDPPVQSVGTIGLDRP